MLFTLSSFAQNGDNPFELEHRLKTKRTTTIDTTEENSSTTTPTTSDNPFDVNRLPQKNRANQSATPTTVTPTVKRTYQPNDDKNFRFGLSLAMLIILALGSSMYRNQLTRGFRAFGNENVMRMLQREKGTVAYLPYYIWYAFFIFNAGIYVYLLMRYYEVPYGNSNWQMFGAAIGGVALAFFLKQTAIKFIGFIFPIKKEAGLYNLLITVFGVVMSILFILINLLIAYGPETFIPIFIYLSYIIILIAYAFRVFRGFSISSKFLRFHKFHFFIYLCTVEIAPALILWKMIVSSAGIQ